mmetsp:Transcript_11613/g.34823  ORF Transcript_11613/g.34823 Transcript_11613/m.34823 type:complete len:348 (+) Transcript_11613:81-1124(+)
MWRHPCTLKLAAVLFLAGSPTVSAQFLGNLKHLAGSLKDSSPGQIASALAGKNPKDLAASAAAAKVSKAAVEALKDATPKGAAAALQHRPPPGGVRAPTTTATPAQAEAAGAALLPATDPRREKVVEALQSVSDFVQKAEEAVNGTSSGSLGQVLHGTAAKKAVDDALSGVVPKSLPEVLDPKSLHKAEDGFKGAKEAVGGTPQAQALEHSSKGLAAALKLPSPGKVAEALGRTAPAVADTLKNSDPAKVRKALSEAGPEAAAAAKRFKAQTAKSSPHKAGEAPEQAAQAEWWRGLPWRWSLPAVFLAACVTTGSLALRAAKRRGARAPALLVEQEIGTWMPSAGSV